MEAARVAQRLWASRRRKRRASAPPDRTAKEAVTHVARDDDEPGADGSGHEGREARPRARHPLRLRTHRAGVRAAARQRVRRRRARASAASSSARRCTATTAGRSTPTRRPGAGSSAARSSSPTRSTPAPRWSPGVRSQTEEDALALEVPRRRHARPARCPSPSELSRLQAEHGMPVTLQIGSPFTWAGSVIGEDRMMMWMLKKPELVHRVLDKVSEFVIKVAEHYAARVRRREPDGLPRRRHRVEQAHLAQAVRELRAALLPAGQRAGHRPGRVARSSSTSAASRTGTSSTGSRCRCPSARSSASAARSRCRRPWRLFPEQIIAGNVDPTLIQEGKPEEVLAQARECIETAKDHRGRLRAHGRLRRAAARAAGERVPAGEGGARVRALLSRPPRQDAREAAARRRRGPAAASGLDAPLAACK